MDNANSFYLYTAFWMFPEQQVLAKVDLLYKNQSINERHIPTTHITIKFTSFQKAPLNMTHKSKMDKSHSIEIQNIFSLKDSIGKWKDKLQT